MNKASLKKFSVLLPLLMILMCAPVLSAEKLAFTITPPLIKATMAPAQTWRSSVKVVNNNSESMTVYCHVYDFKSNDKGLTEFIQTEEQIETYKNSTHLLSKWIEITKEAVVIMPQQSAEIPYTVSLPENAEPGGHYAAIMIGTKPQEDLRGTGISVSSMIASLIMLRVKGEINEKGMIAQFNTEKSLYQEPDVKFNIKFQNSGNVHLQPRGNIKIYNSYKDEVAEIDFNKDIDYGNVLPDSAREWSLDWKGRKGLTQMGRYKAVLVASFGEEAQQTDYKTAYFWVINFKTLAFAVLPIILLIILIIILIRLYIRKVIARTQRQISENIRAMQQAKKTDEANPKVSDIARIKK